MTVTKLVITSLLLCQVTNSDTFLEFCKLKTSYSQNVYFLINKQTRTTTVQIDDACHVINMQRPTKRSMVAVC